MTKEETVDKFDVASKRDSLLSQGVSPERVEVYLDKIIPMTKELFRLCEANQVALVLGTQITKEIGSLTSSIRSEESGFMPSILAAACEVLENNITLEDIQPLLAAKNPSKVLLQLLAMLGGANGE